MLGSIKIGSFENIYFGTSIVRLREIFDFFGIRGSLSSEYMEHIDERELMK